MAAIMTRLQCVNITLFQAIISLWNFTRVIEARMSCHVKVPLWSLRLKETKMKFASNLIYDGKSQVEWAPESNTFRHFKQVVFSLFATIVGALTPC